MSDEEKFAAAIAKSSGQDEAWASKVAEQLRGLWHGQERANVGKPQDCCGGAVIDHSPPQA